MMDFLELPATWWQVCFILSAVTLLTLVLWRRYFSTISDVPGPCVASFTRLWHMYRILKGNQNLELIRLHKEHGHFVRLSYDEVSVSHPDAIRTILMAPFHKGQWYKIHALPDYRYQSPMSTTDPKAKANKSRYIAGAYSVSNILRSEEHIDHSFEAFFRWLDIHAEQKVGMDIDKYISFATFDVIGEIVFSKSFGFLELGHDIGNAIRNSLALNAYIAVAGYFRWINVALLANPMITWLSVMPMGHLFDTTTAVLADREKNMNKRFDAVQYWLKQHEQHPDKLSIREIGTQALAAVGAGSDTVAAGLQSFIYHMIRHQNAWDRAHSEIKEAVGKGFCKTSVVSWTDSQRLPFLQACIKEALRVFGPVPMGLPRIVPKEGLAFRERTLPEGTIVSVNPWVIHHSQEIWGQDAAEFRPDRWFLEDAAEKEQYWIPFGAGYGSCPGQNVAKIELAKMAATLVRDYSFRQVVEWQQWKWKAYFTVVPHSWPVFVSRQQDADGDT